MDSIIDNLKHMVTSRAMKTLLRLIPLDDVVLFPGMQMTLPVDLGDDPQVLLVPRHGNQYAKVGVVASVVERIPMPGRGHAVALSGLHRGVVGAAQPQPDGGLRAQVEEAPDASPPRASTHELEQEYRAVVQEILELRGDDGRIAAFLRSVTEPGPLVATAAR
jgi:ATP-dependent Lon protease